MSRLVAGFLAGLGAVFWFAAPAQAHGLGGRLDLPIPAWQLAWAASFAVAASFAALTLFWATPRLRAAAVGVPLPRVAQQVGRLLRPIMRVLGLAAFGVVLYAALWVDPDPTVNIASYAVFIIFWVGVPLVSVLFGDVWAALNPFYTLADAGAWIKARLTGQPLSTVDRSGGHHWWAVASILGFLWLELAFHDSASPRAIGVFLLVYLLAMLSGASRFGRGWVRNADGFGVLFTQLATMSSLGRDESGVGRARLPLSGLANTPVKPGTVTFILVVLGTTTFDGFTRSSIWLEIASGRAGWGLTAVNTAGMVFMVGLVMALYRLAIIWVAKVTGDPEWELGDAFAPSLIPIAAAYIVAHYFSFLLFEGQTFFALVSDPFGLGWNLFGTAGSQIDYTVLSPDAIAWIQTGGIAVGHMLGVVVAHDRALELYPARLAVRSQYPILAVMIAYTITGLLLLLGA